MVKGRSMKEIPIGVCSFQDRLKYNYIYVDKTKEILSIIKTNRYTFFSRPRRFGKSLTLDTIETLFTYGTEPYFKGTYIAGNNEDGTPRWTEPKYPVLHLDFSRLDVSSLDVFRKDFLVLINEQCQKLGIEKLDCVGLKIGDIISAFTIQLKQTYVLLIDEYDAPLNTLIDNNEMFEIIRNEIRYFYASIKTSDVSGKIRFLLVTGITRFREVSIFSAGTNIKDISYHPQIATLVGYTRDEIELYFKDYIDIAIEKLNHCTISSLSQEQYLSYKERLLNKLATYYDNICFDEYGETSVFSTWSVNNFFKEASEFPEVLFGDYWYDNGGRPSILVKYLNSHLVDFDVFEQPEIILNADKFKNPTTLQSMDQNVLMTQCGYLSLKKGYKISEQVALTIPNLELRKALTRLTILKVFGNFFDQESFRLKSFFKTANTQNIVDKFNEILAKIPRSNRYYNFENEHQIKTVLQMFVLGSGISCYREVYESQGFPDFIIELDSKIIIIEFKYTKNSNEVEGKLDDGVNQILARDYGASFDCNKDRLKFAVVYDANLRKLAAFKEC